MPEEKTLTEVASLEQLKYKEQLAEKMGLPSSYGMNLMKEVCNDMVQSGMVPKHFGDNPMAVFMAAMRGREMGLSPAESIFETFWSAPGGRLGMYSAKMLDIMHRGGVTTKFVSNTATECEITFTPPAPHQPYTAIFKIEEAKAAGLVKPDSNWVKWPSDMCKARAIARGWRAMLGAFKGGANLYAKEELEDFEPALEKPNTAAQEAKAEAEFNPGRKSQRAAAALPEKPEDVIEGVSIEAQEVHVPRRGRPRKEQPVTPAQRLYTALGCKTQGDFDAYGNVTGLSDLQGSEADSFCYIAAKTLEAKTLTALHKYFGYTKVLGLLMDQFGLNKPEELLSNSISVSTVAATLETLLREQQADAPQPMPGEQESLL